MSRQPPDGHAVHPDPAPDDDIAALFDAQAGQLADPPELDAGIRAAAREVAIPSVTVRRHHLPPRWLAAAAVVALALAIVPLARRAPEPSLPERELAPQTTGVADGASAARQGTAERTDAKVLTAEPVPESRSESRSRRETESVSRPAPDPTLEDTSAAARTSSFAGPTRPPAIADDPFDGYRETPGEWLDRLRERLRADGPTRELREEYARFRARYPDVEPAFDPMAVARENESERR